MQLLAFPQSSSSFIEGHLNPWACWSSGKALPAPIFGGHGRVQCENPTFPTGARGPRAWLLGDARLETQTSLRGDLFRLTEEPQRSGGHGEDRERQSTASVGRGWFLQHHHDNAEAKEGQELLGNALPPHRAIAPSKAAPSLPPSHFLGCGVVFGL